MLIYDLKKKTFRMKSHMFAENLFLLVKNWNWWAKTP